MCHLVVSLPSALLQARLAEVQAVNGYSLLIKVVRKRFPVRYPSRDLNSQFCDLLEDCQARETSLVLFCRQ